MLQEKVDPTLGVEQYRELWAVKCSSLGGAVLGC